MSFLEQSKPALESPSFADVPVGEVPPSQKASPYETESPQASLLSGGPPRSTGDAARVPPSYPPTPTGPVTCFWSLLSSNLTFLSFDPALAASLQDQADALVGTSLFTFVRPDEAARVEGELAEELHERGMHGKVAKAHLTRAARMRYMLGHSPPNEVIATISADEHNSENYVPVEIVINWVADGVVLCFLHLDVEDRAFDEQQPHTSSGCGSTIMNSEHAQAVYESLLRFVPHNPNSPRVFQLLWNRPDRSLLMSWPPESPFAKDCIRISGDVRISSSADQEERQPCICTKRFKLGTTASAPDGPRNFLCILIPHGSVIFAIHDISDYTPPVAEPVPSQMAYHLATYASHPAARPPFLEIDPYRHPESGPSHPSHLDYGPRSAPIATHYSGKMWLPGSENGPHHPHYASWPPQSQSLPARSTSYLRDGPGWPGANGGPVPSYPYQRSESPYVTNLDGSSDEASQPEALDEVPAPKRGPKRARSTEGMFSENGGSARRGGNPPVGLLQCAGCGTTSAPEWRKGPSGKKDLCNACGLRWSRARDKSQGGGPVRKRKRSTALPRGRSRSRFVQEDPAQDPSVQHEENGTRASAFAAHIAHGEVDDSALEIVVPSSAPANVYSHSTVSSLHGHTPSPSPTSSSFNFGEYSYHQPASAPLLHPDSRWPSSHDSYYTPQPAPVSLPHLHGGQGNQHSLPSLSRLEFLSHYSGTRGHHMPSAHAHGMGPMGMSSLLPVSSFERERERDTL